MGSSMVKVIRDKGGVLINIGAWDYMPELRGAGIVDAHGEEITKLVNSNPLPEGAYEDQAEIVIGADGGLYEKGDPRA